jgi:hypothetical protein
MMKCISTICRTSAGIGLGVDETLEINYAATYSYATCGPNSRRFNRGTYVVTLTPKAGGDAQIARRRFLEVWKREDRVWRAFRAMDNVGTDSCDCSREGNVR